MDVSGKKYPKDTFQGRVTPAYLIHDLPKLRNALDLLLANLGNPEVVTSPIGEYASENPVKPRPYEFGDLRKPPILRWLYAGPEPQAGRGRWPSAGCIQRRASRRDSGNTDRERLIFGQDQCTSVSWFFSFVPILQISRCGQINF